MKLSFMERIARLLTTPAVAFVVMLAALLVVARVMGR
jgi:hypothetical protein